MSAFRNDDHHDPEKWVLMVFVGGETFVSGFSQEFNSEDSCRDAQDALVSELKGLWADVCAVCAKK